MYKKYLLACVTALAGCRTNIQESTTLNVVPALQDTVSALDKMVKNPGVWILGQPSQLNFESLGITAVLNIRTPEEMADPASIKFDEAAYVQALRMHYEIFPLAVPS